MHRVGKCFGLPVWKWGKIYIELWVCFEGVEAHIHPGQASEIVPLFGWAHFVRVKPHGIGYWIGQDIHIGISKWFHSFTVPADCTHWFNTKFLIFLNISDRSAATNIVYE